MSTRIHTNIVTMIAAALVITAVTAPGAVAGTSKATRIAIPPSLARLHEPGSTGWVPVSPRAQSSRKPVDPLAIGYLMGKGLSPSEVNSWTTGACSHQVKAASCSAMLPWTNAAGTSSKHLTGSPGFQWADAGIGAGFTLGIVLILAAAGAGLLISRQNRRQQSVHA